MENAGLTIAEAADETGLTPDTLRYYEKGGLMLREVPRGSSGHRRYEDADLSWIRLISKLRSTACRSATSGAMPISCAPARQRAGAAGSPAGDRQVVLARLAEVQDHLGAIDFKIGLYTDTLARPLRSA